MSFSVTACHCHNLATPLEGRWLLPFLPSYSLGGKRETEEGSSSAAAVVLPHFCFSFFSAAEIKAKMALQLAKWKEEGRRKNGLETSRAGNRAFFICRGDEIFKIGPFRKGYLYFLAELLAGCALQKQAQILYLLNIWH